MEVIGEWCQKHWKLIVTAVIVVVAVVLICTGVGAILTGAAMGALMGAGIGGLSGGLESLANGGSFWEGFENGAFSGAISGAVMGGAMADLGQLGATLGHGIKCASALEKTIKVTAAVTKTISTVMGGFDTLAMMDKTFGIFGGNLADFNAQLHESALYNTFQIGVTALAVFTNGMSSTMSCFVAGTLVLTACGLVAIETIKAGDKVISTNPDTGVTEEKTVLEAFRRTATELVHLTIGGEVITTTHEHPFYVAEKGFVNAGKLRTCDTLLDSNQNRLTIDDISFETSEETTTVYNFKVEDYHTYFVATHCIFVHNAECTPLTSSDRGQLKEETGWSDDVIDNIETKEQAGIYKKANLTETEVNGRKCLVKDIDMDYVDPKTKLTNRELMQKGRSPIDSVTGEKIELHHMGQNYDSPFAELCANSEHGGGNDIILHNKAKSSWRQDSILKNRYNNVDKPNHWKNR